MPEKQTVGSSSAGRPVVVVPKPKTKKKKTWWETFAKCVSISGLSELYTETNKCIQCMFACAIFVFSICIIYFTYQLLNKHLQDSINFDVTISDELIIPFPNITLCLPSNADANKLQESIRIPDHVSKKLKKMLPAERKNFLKWVYLFLTFSMEGMQDVTDLDSLMKNARYIKDVTRLTYEMHSNKMDLDFARYLLPTCEQSISNCQFNGKPVNCCQQISIMDDGRVCFRMLTESMDESLNWRRSIFSPVVFQADLTMNWSQIFYFSDTVTDGFLVFVDEAPNFYGRPIALPSGMNAFIEVARPRLRSNYSMCVGREQVPQLKFGNYDSRGDTCKYENVWFKLLKNYFGCITVMQQYLIPMNESCGSDSRFVFKIIITYGMLNVAGDHTLESMFAKDLHSIFYDKSQCLGVCKAWEYNPRVSYAQFTSETENATDISRSRVTVTLSSAYYENRVEQQPTGLYIIFGDVAGVASLYLGLSVITVAEVIYYGMQLCSNKKNRQVQSSK